MGHFLIGGRIASDDHVGASRPTGCSKAYSGKPDLDALPDAWARVGMYSAASAGNLHCGPIGLRPFFDVE